MKILGKLKANAVFVLCAAGVILLDQITKLAVLENIPWEKGNPTYHFGAGSGEPIAVIDGLFYIVHITNEGAAWGMLSGRTYLLTSIALMALLALWLFRKHVGFNKKWGGIALGLFAGGVVGNLIDRLCYGHVVDFLDVHIPIVNYRWPAFNIADCGITIGVAIYIIFTFIDDYRERKDSESAELLRPKDENK